MTVPGLPDIEAAWRGLAAETRDRIGIIAVDMVFQGFVYGDVYVVNGTPDDRAVSDESIRGAAAEAEDRRLNELHSVVEAALPGLFGPEGENPAWCANPGPRP